MTNTVSKDPLKKHIVRSIDVGYGNVKFVKDHKDGFGPVECDIFPSRSPVSADKSLGAGLLKGRDTVVIKIGNTEYEVGKDVSKAQGTYDVSSVLRPYVKLHIRPIMHSSRLCEVKVEIRTNR